MKLALFVDAQEINSSVYKSRRTDTTQLLKYEDEESQASDEGD